MSNSWVVGNPWGPPTPLYPYPSTPLTARLLDSPLALVSRLISFFFLRPEAPPWMRNFLPSTQPPFCALFCRRRLLWDSFGYWALAIMSCTWYYYYYIFIVLVFFNNQPSERPIHLLCVATTPRPLAHMRAKSHSFYLHQKHTHTPTHPFTPFTYSGWKT